MRLALAVLLSLSLSASAAAQTAPTPPPAPSPAKPATPAPTTPAAPRRPAPAAAQNASVTVTFVVTNGVGEPLADVSVNADGPLDRSGTTDATGTLRIQGLRVGTYRVRFDAADYLSFEKEVTTRAAQRTQEVAVTLTAAPKVEPPPPPPPPPPPAKAELPPPGDPKVMVLTDWLEKNFIGNREPQKASALGCSGLGQAFVWQVREPWQGRQHDTADGLFYVIGGEGTLRITEKDVQVSAGSFAVVPRGMSYTLTRRGRNPVIVLAVLAGDPCGG